MARRKKPRKPDRVSWKRQQAFAQRERSVRRVAVEMALEEDPALLDRLLAAAMQEFQMLYLYLCPGLLIDQLDEPTLTSFHLTVLRSGAFPPS